MQSKLMSTYKVVHFNGQVEIISAESMKQALENTSIPELDSPSVSSVRLQTDIRTLFPEEKEEVVFTTTSLLTDGTIPLSCIATPENGTIHVGDEISLRAISGRNYTFIEWQLNGKRLASLPSFVYTMEGVDGGLATFTAVFKESTINWETEVNPSEATGEGCIAFPSKGETEAGGELELLAVAKGDYTFDHWERNGLPVSTNELLHTNAEPLAVNEEKAIYTAFFTQA